MTQVGVHEVGRANWGPKVSRYLRSTAISFPAAWCMAFVHWCYEQCGLTIGGGASVGNFLQWGRVFGYIVERPLRGDAGCWELTGDGWPDHVFLVVRVLRVGPVWLLRTIEGNTTPGTGGRQDEGGGVYVRRRVVRTGRVRAATFVRIPGRVRPGRVKKLAA